MSEFRRLPSACEYVRQHSRMVSGQEHVRFGDQTVHLRAGCGLAIRLSTSVQGGQHNAFSWTHV